VKKQVSWNDYFLSIAAIVATRSDCVSRGVGAVLVRDSSIIATGYNGSPKGIKNCSLGGCDRCKDKLLGKIPSGEQLDKCICAHAEENTIAQAANNGISTKNSILYCTHLPCIQCSKLLIQAGIKKILYKEDYASTLTIKYLHQAHISLKKVNKHIANLSS